MSIKNKNILITRDFVQSQEFAELIKDHGANPIIFPTIEIQKPNSWEELDRFIQSINLFDGLLFTSQNAVKYFFERFNIHKPRINSDKFLIFAVGEKTKHEIEKYNCSCTAIPETFNAEYMAELLQNYDIRNKKFLFPRGNISRDTIIQKIKKLGADVRPVVVYYTVCPIPNNVGEISQNLLSKKIDVITFTSPSSAINFFKIINDQNIKFSINSLTKIAVIGNTTADALLKINIQPDIIANPSTIEGLLKSIINYFETDQSKTASTD